MPADHRKLLSQAREEKPGGRKAPGPVTAPNNRWWTLPPGKDVAQAITATLQALKQAQSLRLTQMVTHARLYGNLAAMGGFATASPLAQLRPAQPGRQSFNLIGSCVDAITAKVAKSKPEPMFLTSGGNYHQQRRASKLTDYTQGVLYENKGHALGVQTFRDAAIWGSGTVQVFAENGRVRLERVMPAELYIDELEAFYGQPRQMHRVKAVDRQTLVSQFPDQEQDILRVESARLDGFHNAYSTSDLLEVRASWHLPSGPGAADGRYVISVGQLVLADESWEHDWFPLAKLDWSQAQYGYWGRSLVETLVPTQVEINQLSWVAARSFRMAGSYKVFIRAGSKVVKDHLNDQVGAIIEYAGDVPPAYVVPPIISAQHLERIEVLKRSGYELAGVSQLSAASQKPAGLNSGRALREMTDIESDRFTVVSQAYEQFYLDLAHLIVRIARDLDDAVPVRVPGKTGLKTVDFASAELDEDQYITKCFPVSSLPNEPAGRLQTVSELVQAGMISPERGRKLLDFPDLESLESLENAQFELLVKVLDDIVDQGIFAPPEPTDNLQEARKLCLEYIAQGRASDLEQERLQQLRDFLSQIDELEAQAQPPQPAGPGMTPQAQPMAPPQSDLIPNAPGIQQ